MHIDENGILSNLMLLMRNRRAYIDERDHFSVISTREKTPLAGGGGFITSTTVPSYSKVSESQ